MASKSKVYFFIDNVDVQIKNKRRLKQVLETLFKKEKKNLESLNYVFCSDKKLLKINQEYLHHDYYTDIITFNLSKEKEEINAEAYISLDRIKDNAAKLNLPVKEEIYRVIFHGALHLCGYKDKSKKQKLEIRKLEDYYLSRMF